MRSHSPCASAVLFAVLLGCGGAAAQQQAATPAPAGQADTLRCTVRSVNPSSGSMEVLTGVGMAIQSMHMQAAPTTPVKVDGETKSLDYLRPGDILWVVYHTAATGGMVTELRKIGRLASDKGGKP